MKENQMAPEDVDSLGAEICMKKDEARYTNFGIVPREVGLAKSVSQKISEGHPTLLNGEDFVQKFLKLKVGVEFYDALMSRPSFQGNWKAVSPAFYLVSRIAELNATLALARIDPVSLTKMDPSC